MGRVANFAATDLSRKRRAMKNNPMFNNPQMRAMFPGMLPASGRVTAPMGFSPPRNISPTSDSGEAMDEDDLRRLTGEAEREWGAIRAAFEQFRARLGDKFQPFDPELVAPIMTPFGPALQYKTYSIAGIWMGFYMGLIVLLRAHPHMPPIAMVAAGVAAHQTWQIGMDLAKAAAGLVGDLSGVKEVSTIIGGALIESCVPLFVAGISVSLPRSLAHGVDFVVLEAKSF
jgi:hypothetical protein